MFLLVFYVYSYFVILFPNRKRRMIHFVVGTKAQMIKVAPVMKEFQERGVPYNFIYTGQHKNTMDQIQSNFGVRSPDTTLYSGSDITGIFQMFLWMIRIIFVTIFNRKRIFKKEGLNDVVLVHGDTFSTLLGAFMGRLAGKKVGHIESGLRSFKLFHPFPEEITRLLVFRLSNIFFCPGDWALDNLRKYSGKKVNTKANTLYDCLMIMRSNSHLIQVPLPTSSFGVVSIHRFENIFNKDRFNFIIEQLILISKEKKLLFILHPPTKKKLQEYGLINKIQELEGIELRPRYDYFQFIKLVENCDFLITDGGSNQEEAFYMGKPTLLFRKTSERPEGIDENIVLSNYDMNVINDFAVNFGVYRRNEIILDISPSKIVCDALTEYI